MEQGDELIQVIMEGLVISTGIALFFALVGLLYSVFETEIFKMKEVRNKLEKQEKYGEKWEGLEKWRKGLLVELEDVWMSWENQFSYTGETARFVEENKKKCRELFKSLQEDEWFGVHHHLRLRVESDVRRWGRDVTLIEEAYDMVKNHQDELAKVDAKYLEKMERMMVLDPLKAEKMLKEKRVWDKKNRLFMSEYVTFKEKDWVRLDKG